MPPDGMAGPRPPASSDLQLGWDNAPLQRAWPRRRDMQFVISRIEEVAVEETGHGQPGRLLEVAAAEALHSCRLALRGWDAWVVEPSPPMLARAREHMRRLGTHIHLVRGIAETLPFPDRSFDRVLCDSAIDHFAAPQSAIREMARVLKPDGRLVVTFVNYGSLSTRVSRIVYELERRLRPEARAEPRFWDTPVPVEHTFECTYPIIQYLCALDLTLDHARGVSIGWNVPGWGAILERLDARRARRLLEALDRVARRRPRMADVVCTVWGPRPVPLTRRPRTLRARARDCLRAIRPGTARVRDEWRRADLEDPIYRCLAENDQRHAAGWRYEVGSAPTTAVGRRLAAVALTGDPDRSWLDDVIARGPFDEVALLGCEDRLVPSAWIAAASGRLTIYEPSRYLIRRLRRDLLGPHAQVANGARRTHTRLVPADLNFIALPPGRFDLVLSHGGLGRTLNLEHLFDQVYRALRPGGLLAFLEYVGERRMQYAPGRLARVNALFADVPVRFRLGGRDEISPAQPEGMSPFAASRSDEILPLVRQRFESVHEATTGRLFPLFLSVDLVAIEREAPELLARLVAAEDAAAGDAVLAPALVYAVFRKPGG